MSGFEEPSYFAVKLESAAGGIKTTHNLFEECIVWKSRVVPKPWLFTLKIENAASGVSAQHIIY